MQCKLRHRLPVFMTTWSRVCSRMVLPGSEHDRTLLLGNWILCLQAILRVVQKHSAMSELIVKFSRQRSEHDRAKQDCVFQRLPFSTVEIFGRALRSSSLSFSVGVMPNLSSALSER